MSILDPSTMRMPLTKRQSDRIAELKAQEFFQFADPDPCFACGNNIFETVAEKDRYGFSLNYCMCGECGYLFANPYYTDTCLSQFYQQHYSVIYGRSVSDRRHFEGEYLKTSSNILPLVKRHHPQAQCILDIGCGFGGSLAAFPKTWRRIGYDFEGKNLEFGRKLGLDMREISKLNDDKNKYDVVMMNQVLEHLRNPVEILVQVVNLLRQKGILYIEVPGIMSMKMRKADPRLAFKNAHRHFFSLSSLAQVAEHAELCLVDGDETIYAVFRKKDELEYFPKKVSSVNSKSMRLLLTEYSSHIPVKNIRLLGLLKLFNPLFVFKKLIQKIRVIRLRRLYKILKNN